MNIDAAALQQERTRLQNESALLGTRIATLSGEIKARLESLGITEADVDKSTEEANSALAVAKEDYAKSYQEYTNFKAQSSAALAQQGVQQPMQPVAPAQSPQQQ